MAAAWSAYLDQEPYEPFAFVDDDGSGSIQLLQETPIPSEVSLYLGEFLYQLRAALDGCVFEAACIGTGQRPAPAEGRLEFPITQTSEAFASSSRKLSGVPPAVCDLIESVQPFRQPADLDPSIVVMNFNRALGILHDWARIDRHRRLHVAGSWASNIRPLIVAPSGTTIVDVALPLGPVVLEERQEIATFHVEGWERGMQLSANPNLFIDLFVDEQPLPCHLNDTLERRLTCMRVAVVTIVGGIAELLDEA